MGFTSRQIGELLRILSLTKPDELTCDECLMQVAEYAEFYLAGKSVPESLSEVKQHLELCSECCDEFRALIAALEGVETIE